MKNENLQFYATTFPNLEIFLEKELKRSRINKIRIHDAVIFFDASLEQAIDFMFNSRVCNYCSLIIFRKTLNSIDELYYSGRNEIKWDAYFTLDKTFAIHSTVIASPAFKHSGFAGLKLKDSIADYFRAKYNDCRPNVDKENPDTLIELRIFKNNALIAVSLNGMALFKRGYRIETNAAPLKETLAAGISYYILKNSRNKDFRKIIDPMCGSGTLIIETTLNLLSIPPSMPERKFGFEKLNLQTANIIDKIRNVNAKKINIRNDFQISAADNTENFCCLTEKNIENAGLKNVIKVFVQDFFKPELDMTESIIIFNPPYGERMYKASDVQKFYQKIGLTLKEYCQKSVIYIFCPSEKNIIDSIGIKPDDSIKLFNGKIVCNLLEFRL